MSRRRREIMRMQIARAAVELFTAKGVTATTGDDIARELGISTRTLWRYFPSKESCVRPLLTSGLDLMADRLRSWPADLSLAEHLERSGALDEDGRTALGAPTIDLIRMTRTEPGLMAVWLTVHQTAEGVFAEAVAERAGAAPDTLSVRVQAAAINVALRVAAEQLASDEGHGESMTALVRKALTTVGDGLGPLPRGTGTGEPGPRLRDAPAHHPG
ncbi:AcrR family transcriptional regulator [Nocardiopsis terrae]|uniref:AcrR family transcriptional regulator n=1 Tax=Nocardiopsis terrae TaxID=372655 RepID=A0ABR9HE57_9ACTN|nr:TetR/AcrR family transcriptional regulator [Nocardiopsis terrae]MBE1457181.1 AcrR family transcriptional regulator [Nocardiopsis terrae]